MSANNNRSIMNFLIPNTFSRTKKLEHQKIERMPFSMVMMYRQTRGKGKKANAEVEKKKKRSFSEEMGT